MNLTQLFGCALGRVVLVPGQSGEAIYPPPIREESGWQRGFCLD